MLTKIRNRQKGFTLIELLIVVAIIGIIAALLIPNFLDALQKAKQKRTVADVAQHRHRDVLVADRPGRRRRRRRPATRSTSAHTASEAGGDCPLVLVPQYLQAVPEKDGWKKDYALLAGDRHQRPRQQVMAIASGGRDTLRVRDVHRGRLRADRLRPGHRLGRRLLRALAAEARSPGRDHRTSL